MHPDLVEAYLCERRAECALDRPVYCVDCGCIADGHVACDDGELCDVCGGYEPRHTGAQAAAHIESKLAARRHTKLALADIADGDSPEMVALTYDFGADQDEISSSRFWLSARVNHGAPIGKILGDHLYGQFCLTALFQELLS